MISCLRPRLLPVLLLGALFSHAAGLSAAGLEPLLVLDTPAAKAYIVDAADPTNFATAPFPDAPALVQGSLRFINRTATANFYEVIVADGAGKLWSQLVEIRLTGPTPPPVGPVNVASVTVSHSAADFAVTCDGKFVVAGGGGTPTPVSAIDSATSTEISTLELPNAVSNVVILDDNASILAVEVDAMGAGLGVRRLTLSGEGELANSSEFLSLPGVWKVITVPGTNFGVALVRQPMADAVTSFTATGMTPVNTVAVQGDFIDSAAFSCAGTSLIVRSGDQDMAGIIDVLEFDAESGIIGTGTSFPVAPAPATAKPGENLVSLSADALLLAVAEGPSAKIYDAATGTFLREFAPVDFAAGDLTFLSCCQAAASLTTLVQQRIDGPDVDNNMIIDTTIPVRGATPSNYTFQVDVNVAGLLPTIVYDQIGPAWNVVSVTPDVAGDRVFQFPGFIGSLFNLPSYIIWIPSDNSGSLTYEIQTRRIFFIGPNQPNVAGPVPQTAGAIAVDVTGNPVLDDNGQPLVGTPFEVTGVP